MLAFRLTLLCAVALCFGCTAKPLSDADAGRPAAPEDRVNGCGPCDGCCLGVRCLPLNAQERTRCGVAGATCESCALDARCVAGVCEEQPDDSAADGAACTSSSCPGGCCDGATCVPGAGQNASSCGAEGASCGTCLSGEPCEGGACAGGEVCDGASCPDGCCVGVVCVRADGQDASTCGLDGEACAPCVAGGSCAAGVCTGPPPVEGCSAASCPTGCCFGAVCVLPEQQSGNACGVGGGACTACLDGQSCDAGSCAGTPTDPGTGTEFEDEIGAADEAPPGASGPSASTRQQQPPPAMPAGSPGGWPRSTLVFSQARMNLAAGDDEFVQLGWINLNRDVTVTVCGTPGPKAARNFYRWSHGSYAPGDCSKDKKKEVNFARWDHVAPTVDGCPGRAGFVEDGRPAARPFLDDCPAHVTSGYGDPAARTRWVGAYEYDAQARKLELRYEVNGACLREYYEDLTLGPGGTLLAMRLDGVRTGAQGAAHEGIGATVGYAYASPKGISEAASFDRSMDAVRTGTFLADGWRFRQARGAGQPERQYEDAEVNAAPIACKTGVYSDHTCGGATRGEPPYLADCATRPNKTAYLQWFLQPFASTSPREQLHWGYHAHKDRNWTGCYHRGSHATPLLQVVDAQGVFRGFVAVEMQRSAATVEVGGTSVADPDSHRETDYRAWRWIESGYEEIVAP